MTARTLYSRSTGRMQLHSSGRKLSGSSWRRVSMSLTHFLCVARLSCASFRIFPTLEEEAAMVRAWWLATTRDARRLRHDDDGGWGGEFVWGRKESPPARRHVRGCAGKCVIKRGVPSSERDERTTAALQWWLLAGHVWSSGSNDMCTRMRKQSPVYEPGGGFLPVIRI